MVEEAADAGGGQSVVFVGCGGGLTQGRLGGVSMVTGIIVRGRCRVSSLSVTL